MELLDLVGQDNVPDQVEGQDAPGALATQTNKLALSAWSYGAHNVCENTAWAKMG